MVKKVTALFIMFISVISLMSCEKKMTRYETEFIGLFDTLTRIVTYSYNKKDFTEHSQLIYDSLKEYHELYDIYNNYPGINNMKTINDNAGIAPVKVDKRIIDLLLFSREWYGKTGGKLNVAMGSVLKIWHDYRTEGIDNPEEAELPPLELLQEASLHTDFNKVLIDEINSTVYLSDPEMSLDVGAVAKGYATEQVSQIAIQNGFVSGLISVGGNLRAIGGKGIREQLWNLGIQNPDTESSQTNIRIVHVRDVSLVTSGDYERYYTVGEKNYNHIIDSETLFPAEYYHAVSILCGDSGIADALSTSIFVMPLEEGKALIEALPDVEAMWVMNSGEISYSSGFENFLKK